MWGRAVEEISMYQSPVHYVLVQMLYVNNKNVYPIGSMEIGFFYWCTVHFHNTEILITNRYVKQWLDSRQILYYKRCVDDILIIYNQNKTNEQDILNNANNRDKRLQFKLSTEENNLINYLYFSIYRNNSNVELGICRKPTSTDTTIHFSSNHPNEHKLAAFNYYINRLLTLPIIKESKQQEWKTILTIARNNAFLNHIIQNLKKEMKAKNSKSNKNH
jgi:hypothetical protein